MTREQRLRNAILDRFACLRQFAVAANIPYSTLMTILTRGVGGASFDAIMAICKALDLDPKTL